MKQSHLFTKMKKEAPKDEVSRNAQLLIRAGFIHKEMAGAYSYLPLGLRVLEKIKQVIREEMNREGGQEMVMTALQEKEIWEKTDRWDDKKVDNWFKTELKNGTVVGLGITHEEPLTRIMTGYISSYRDLPRYAYQFQNKFRNEIRAKSGIMRGREFMMKDMYDFSRDEAQHNEFYNRMREAYTRVFHRVGIGHLTYVTFASGGIFSEFSEEFQTVSEAGEDIIYIDEKKGIAESLKSIGGIYLLQHNLVEAQHYAKKSLAIAQELGYPINIRNAANLLSQVYEKQASSSQTSLLRKSELGLEALSMHKLFVNMSDSINNEESKKASAQQQAKYEYEKQKAIDDAENEKLVAIEKEAKAKQKVITYATAGGLGLVAIFLIFVFNRLQVTKKQKHIITQQKHLVEEKHREITDSINYAERIQRSFLATTEMLDQHLKDYFVFFRPKDVVSGDFYWAGELNNGNFAFSVADSTGHGVPGAIMSILNISSLEKSIEKETAPDQILNKTRKIIIERLRKDGSSEGGKDGMDCSLLVLNQDRTQLSFAAANNPVFIVRAALPSLPEGEESQHASQHQRHCGLDPQSHGKIAGQARNDGYELIEFKPDKMPVGKHDNDTENFTLYTTPLQKGDVIYALTDGFPDQFGGEKGKKYMIKNLKELLLQIAHLPVQEQEQKLADEFDKWKGENEQVDDVCIIGVRV